MNLITKQKISPKGKLNEADIKKIARDTARFFSAPVLVYITQLSGTLSQNGILTSTDLLPSLLTVGAIEGWILGIVLNFFLKLNDGTK